MVTPDLYYTQADGFSEYQRPAEDEWKDKEDEKDYLARLGFESIWELGMNDNAFVAKAYARETHPKYLVSTLDTNRGDHIFVPDFASVFDLRLKLAPLAQSEDLAMALDDVVPLLRKLFRFQHGHEHWSACDECDPEHMRQMRERKRKRAAEEAAKAKAAAPGAQ